MGLDDEWGEAVRSGGVIVWLALALGTLGIAGMVALTVCGGIVWVVG